MPPLTAADLTDPAGPLSPSLFPGDTTAAFAARLTAYLGQAYARLGAVSSDRLPDDRRHEAAAAWAEYRALAAVVRRLSTTPASVTTVDQGARAYSGEQIKQAVKERDAALARYTALVPAAAEPPARSASGGAYVGGGSTSAPVAVEW